MFGWGKAEARKRAWGSDQIGKQLAEYSEQVLYSENGSKLGHFSDDWKQPIVDEIRSQIRDGIQAAANPILSCRNLIAAEALALGQLHALTLTEADRASFGYGHARLISCQLHQYIRACYPLVGELAEYLRRFPDSNDGGLLSWANTQGAIRNYRLNAFNMVRCHFNDMIFPKERDWLAPLLASATVWFEDDVRQKLGIGRLTDDPLIVLEISTMVNIVKSGERDPLTAWETNRGALFADCL